MITVEAVRAHLGIPPADTDDDDYLTQCVDAVSTWVSGLPVIVDRADPAAEWPADVDLGAVLLAAHLYHARSSPYGRATLAVVPSGPAYADPEIARLLGLRRWARPRVGGAAP